MAPGGRPRKHVCNKCDKNFRSGNALGGHMSYHWRNVKQRKNTASPSAIAVDLHVSLLSPIDEKPLLLLSGTQCQLHSKVFSNCKSPREHMRKHSEKVVTKPVEEAAGLIGALAIVDCDYNVMLSPPVKRKRSKRETPAVNFDEMDVAAALLLLSEHSDKTLASEDIYGGDKDGNISASNGLKDVKLDASDHLLVRSDELKKPKNDKSSAYDNCYGQCKKDNTLMPNVPKKHTDLISNDYDKDNTLIPTAPKDSAYEGCFGQREKDTNLIPNDPKKDSTLIPTAPKDSAYEGCFGQREKDTNSIPNDPKKDSTLIPTAPKDSAYEGCFGQREKDTNLIPNDPKKDNTLIPNVPKDNYSTSNVPKEVELSVFCHELASDAELSKPRTYSSVEQMKCGDLSAAVKANSHQCNACGRSFVSGQALGGHMRCHHPRCNRHCQGATDCPDSVVIKEQKQKLRLDSRCLISEFQIPLTKTAFA